MFYNNKIQIALFFNKFEERADKIFYKLNDEIDEVFDNPPINIPVPPDAPPEIPVLQASSSNGFYSLTISKVRIDFTLINHIVDDEANSRAKDFQALASKFVNYISNNHPIVRFGLVSTTIATESNPVDKLRNKYFNNNVGKPYELSVRFNNRKQKDKYLINDIVEISSTFAVLNNKQTHINVINRDINNVAQQGVVLRKKFTEEILEVYYSELLVDKIEALL